MTVAEAMVEMAADEVSGICAAAVCAVFKDDEEDIVLAGTQNESVSDDTVSASASASSINPETGSGPAERAHTVSALVPDLRPALDNVASAETDIVVVAEGIHTSSTSS